jgi:hypothetical protein
LEIPGIGWGLPIRASDQFLFSGTRAWDGRTIAALAPSSPLGGTRAADVAAHILDRSRAQFLNTTDVGRAQIALRYRLYTANPDEMITVRALAGMNPHAGDFDPRLYQYGGLWIYSVAVLIAPLPHPHYEAAYLDRPELVARFYVVMRLYSAVWGYIAAVFVWRFVRRFRPCPYGTPLVAAVLFLAMPSAVSAAHDAKPHLMGLALSMIAIDLAASAIALNRPRRLIAAGAVCGLAIGSVLAAAPAIVLIPVAAGQMRGGRARALLLALLAAIVAYAVTNPYVIIHLCGGLGGMELLRANLSNTAAMYRPAYLASAAGANALWLVAEGTGRWVALFGVVAVLGSFARSALGRTPAHENLSLALLVGVPAVAAFVPFVIFAGGKPPEYGRFALLIDTALVIAAVSGLQRLRLARGFWLVALLIAQLVAGGSYTAACVDDARGRGTRYAAARELAELQRSGQTRLVVFAEPAPYCLPPVNLFDWNIELAARDQTPESVTWGVGVMPADHAGAAEHPPLGRRVLGLFVDPDHPLTWADKPFAVLELSPGPPFTPPPAPPPSPPRLALPTTR